MKDVEKSVSEHDTYKTTYHACLDQILSVKQELSRLSDPAGGKEEAKKKLDKLKVKYHSKSFFKKNQFLKINANSFAQSNVFVQKRHEMAVSKSSPLELGANALYTAQIFLNAGISHDKKIKIGPSVDKECFGRLHALYMGFGLKTRLDGHFVCRLSLLENRLY